MSTKRGKFDFLTEAQAERKGDDAQQAQELEKAQSSKSTSAQSSTERRSSGQRIRADLLRAIKILSAETGTPQYLLIEEALESYIARKRTS